MSYLDSSRGERSKKETMCIQNLGASVNTGNPIPVGTPIRIINKALNNNPSATALTDEEIEDLSKHNEDAIGPGRAEYNTYYRIEFVGKFSFDNICYAIVRPCRCVKSHVGETIILKTAKFSAMNTITKLIDRLNEDYIEKVTIYRIGVNDKEEIIAIYRNTDEVISFIQEDKLRKHPVLNSSSNNNISKTNETKDNLVDVLTKQIADLNDQLCEKEEEVEFLKKENTELQSMIYKIRLILEEKD